jgi:hypothetical protein
MAKLRPDIEWAPDSRHSWDRFGIRECADNKWEVLRRLNWNNEVVAVVDSRDAAIGFVKLLRGE